MIIYCEYIIRFAGQVDQLEDRYLGMVEAASSNLALSTFLITSKVTCKGAICIDF